MSDEYGTIENFEIYLPTGELCSYNPVEDEDGYTYDSTHLETLIIPEGVKIIHSNECFNDLEQTPEYIELPESLTELSSGCFNHFDNIENIIDIRFGSALENCPRDIFNNSFKIEKFLCNNPAYELCNGLVYNKTKGILLFALENVTNVIIPNFIKRIGNNAFQDCEHLQSVVIPESVESIGIYAFDNCKQLSKLVLPSHLKKFEYSSRFGNKICSTFRDCINLRKVEIPEGITFIPDELFIGCKNLKNIKFPVSLTEIGDDAFSNCYELTKINLSKCTNLITIGDYVFSDCYSLTEIKLPVSLKQIGTCTFQRCILLPSVNFAPCSSMVSMGSQLFTKCVNLRSVTLPYAIKNMGDDIFAYCINLNTVKNCKNLHKQFGSTDLDDLNFEIIPKNYLKQLESAIMSYL